MAESFKVNAKIGDALVVKKQFDFMGEPMFEVGQSWTFEEQDCNYIKVQNEENGYWIGYDVYLEAFEGKEF
jgi:hypothetical protein